MTAVPETMGLKFVFTGLPLSSFPSQSPASDWIFLNAGSEFDPANSGAIAIRMSRRRRSKRGSLFIEGSPLVSGLRCGNGIRTQGSLLLLDATEIGKIAREMRN
jgi:hypothetical protein